jgi:TonB family protein
VSSAFPLTLPARGAQGGTSLEVRLAASQPGPGLVEAVVQGSDRKVYMQPGAIVTGADVTSARVVAGGGGQYSVGIDFSAAGSSRLEASTRGHIGHPVAIVLNGRVLAAPVVRSPIRESAVISGNFTREEADRIVAGFAAPAAVAVPGAAQAPVTSADPGVVMPVLLTEVRPHYTAAALQAKIHGDVEMAVVVRGDGSVGDVTVTQSLDSTYGLDDAAVEAAQQWTFTPGTQHGRPVDVLVHVSMRFTLK